MTYVSNKQGYLNEPKARKSLIPDQSSKEKRFSALTEPPIQEGIYMAPQPPSTHWYAIRTRSRSEKIVRDQLVGRGIEEYLPLVKRISHWKDRKKVIEWPLFQGYCFARFCNEQGLTVLQTPGVVEIVGSGRRPEPILEEEILALRHVMSQRRPYESHPYLEEGMTVSVTRGPFEGIKGTLVRKGDGCRLVLSIHLIRQSVAVHIDADDVMPIEKPTMAI
jgi:transcription antitermination factor NusG